MKNLTSRGVLVFTGLLAMAIAIPPAGAVSSFTITDLVDAGSSQGSAVNNLGQVAGYSESSSGSSAVRWDADRTAHPLAFLGTGISAQALGINELGQTVGFSRTEAPLFGSPSHAVVWDRNGNATDLDPGGFRSQASGINNHGQVSGSLRRPGGNFIAVRWDLRSGTRTDLPTLPDAPVTIGRAINENGEMVGHSGNDAVRWDADGKITDLGTLPGGFAESEARAISNSGYVAGVSGGHAVRWDRSGVMTDLGPGEANGVDEQGEVVGWTTAPGFSIHAILWDRNGAPHDLGVLPGGFDSEARGISDSGRYVTGDADIAGGDRHAVRWG